MKITEYLKDNAYPGRGLAIGRTSDGKKAVLCYFIMGRSAGSRNRVFEADGEGSVPVHSTSRSFQTRLFTSIAPCVCWASIPL